MDSFSRDERLWVELERLKSLIRRSSIFSLRSEGQPPKSYRVSFHGKGIAEIDPASAEPVWSESHEILIQLPDRFPQQEPDLKWLTPLVHPNLSNSGFVELQDLGLEWSPELSLEIICERLWDTIRLAVFDLSRATIPEVRDWFENRSTLRLPLDPRPLRDKEVAEQINIVEYSRCHPRRGRPAPPRSIGEVLFIGTETDSQPAHEARDANGPEKASRMTNQPNEPNGDDEVLYID